MKSVNIYTYTHVPPCTSPKYTMFCGKVHDVINQLLAETDFLANILRTLSCKEAKRSPNLALTADHSREVSIGQLRINTTFHQRPPIIILDIPAAKIGVHQQSLTSTLNLASGKHIYLHSTLSINTRLTHAIFPFPFQSPS